MSVSPSARIVILLLALLVVATFMVSRAGHSTGQRSGTPAAKARAPAAPVSIGRGHVGRTARTGTQRAAADRHHKASSHGSNPSRPRSPAATRDAGTSVPGRVVRAVGAGKLVVLLFFDPKGAEDQAVRSAVRAIPRKHGVVILEDDVAHVSRYERVLPASGIDRSPAVVIIGRQHRAQTLQGFLDSDSLRQYVEDARG
jgi:hypothetical protein